MSAPPNIVTWLQALHRESDLPLAVRAVVAAMATRADNESLEFFQTYSELSAWTGRDERTVRRNVKAAIDAGWLVCVSSGNSRRANTYRLAYGETLESVDQGIDKNVQVQNRFIQDIDKNVNEPGHSCQLDPDIDVLPTSPTLTSPSTSPLETRSTSVERVDFLTEDHLPGPEQARSANQNKEVYSFAPPAPIQDYWHVNGLHVNLGKELGLPSVHEIGRVFKTWAVGEDVRSSDWDAKFSALLRDVGESGDWPWDDSGFGSVGEYDVSGVLASTTVDELDERPALPTGQVYVDEWLGSNACRFACRDHGLDFEDEIERFRNKNSDSADSPMNFEKRFISSVRSVRV